MASLVSKKMLKKINMPCFRDIISSLIWIFYWKYKIKYLISLLRFRCFWSISSFSCELRTPNHPGVQKQCLKGVHGADEALIQPYLTQ